MENECEALPGVAYPGVRDNRSTINTKTGYDMMMNADLVLHLLLCYMHFIGMRCYFIFHLWSETCSITIKCV